MQIGEIIRKYRKERNMTQEEMANRLGVTAPAVNKWENGNSMPDIMMLAPIARLLEISLDTLLSFQDELTPEEITHFIYETSEQLKSKPYDEAFQWSKKLIEQYPNCKDLIWQIAVLLDAKRLTEEIPDSESYDDYIVNWYTRALESENEITRNRAADSLYGFYSRKEQYDKAEEYLSYFSLQNPERKFKQAQIYSNTGRINEAYKAFEELLFSYYTMVSAALHNIYMLAMQENNLTKAHMLIDKQQELANVFDMGGYHELTCKLEYETSVKDADAAIKTMEEILASIDTITDFRKSPLYEHMDYKAPSEEFTADLKEKILTCFRDEETYGFLKGDERYRELIK